MSTQTCNVLYIGAGNVIFGSDEGPWCHSTRIEKKLGARLRVVGIVDPDVEKAATRLAVKQAEGVAGYENTKVFPSISAAEALAGPAAPRMALVGIQPQYRGSTDPGKDCELQLKKSFPGIALFVEKPISAVYPLEKVRNVSEALRGNQTSVGYMLRYLKAVERVKKIIKDNELEIMSVTCQYFMAYAFAGQMERTGYFDKSLELGPIVGQATHIIDLARYICGEADLSTVAAVTVEPQDKPGHLSKVLFEGGIKEENRIPRITNAIWKWKNGGTGSLIHAVALHDGGFDSEIVIVADGWKLRLVDMYGNPKLYIRGPTAEEDAEVDFSNDDPFFSEVANFIDVMDGNAEESSILSTYDDALRTYEMTGQFGWQVRTRRKPV